MTVDNPRDDYRATVAEIARAAATLREALGGADEPAGYMPDEEPSGLPLKVPLAGYCLKVALQLWTTQGYQLPADQHYQDGYQDGLEAAYRQAGADPGTPQGLPTPAEVRQAVAQQAVDHLVHSLTPESRAALRTALDAF